MSLFTVDINYAIQKLMINNLKMIVMDMGKIYPVVWVDHKTHMVIKNYMSSKEDIIIYPKCIKKSDHVILQYEILEEESRPISSVQCPIHVGDKMSVIKWWLTVRPLVNSYIKLNNLDINDYLYLEGL